MKVYQRVTGHEKSITNFEVVVDDTYSGFSILAGTATEEGDDLTNISYGFNGYEGYIFDFSGRFVGGYSKDIPINISVHMKDDNTYSYFINDALICNNMDGITGFNSIEFNKHGDSSIFIEYIA